MCRQDSTSKPLVIPLYIILCPVQLFASRASRASSRCKHDVGALSWLCGNSRKSAHPPLFGRLVRCSAHGPFFARLRYNNQTRKYGSLAFPVVPVRCRVKAALRHTYITLPQVASHIARLWTRLKLGQEDKTNMSVTFYKAENKR